MDNSNTFTVQLPGQNLAGACADMRSRLVTWDWRQPIRSRHRSFCLDLTPVSFIEPWALALYTAYALSVSQEHNINAFARLDDQNPSNKYVRQMGLDYVLSTGESTLDWDTSIQNTGLHVIRDHPDVTRFIQSLVNLRLAKTSDVSDALEYCMAEIGRNVVQHSYSPIGGVAIAQYFPERRAIQIAIADCGKGVFEALRLMYPEVRNSQEALKLAVLPHVSGAFDRTAFSGSENAGLGLFFTKEICWRSQGSFWIASSDAVMGIQRNDVNASDRIHRRINSWKGTLVAMDIPELGVSDFADILSTCRNLSDQARQCSGRAGLDFLDELPDIEDLQVVEVGPIKEDVKAAAEMRESILLPAMTNGLMLVLDFGGAKFVTQSFVHALLHDVFSVPGSLLRLSFVNCSPSSEEAIRTVAAYTASYDICVNHTRRLPRDGSL